MTEPECYPLFPHPGFKNKADKLLDGIGRFVAFHPGSGSGIKNWPHKRFEELADLLLKKGLDCVWISGPAEKAFQTPKTGKAIHNASLPALVHVLSRCSLYIGNDSGISHLAAACGAPSVVLFGPSDPAVWKPLGKNVSIVFKNQSPCFPCHSLPDRGLKNKGAQEAAYEKPCMSDISVLEVFDACTRTAGII